MRTSPTHPGAAGARQRRGASLLAGVMLLLATAVILTSACDTKTNAPTSSATATGTPAGLPAFADWRVIYADNDGRIHAISLDSKRDVTGGAMLSNLAHSSLGFPRVSPDGHWLAQPCGGSMCLLDLTGRHASLRYPSWLYPSISWSADSSMLALGEDGVEGVMHVPDGATRQIPPIQGATFAPIGWVDGAHLAGTYVPIPPTSTPAPTPTERSDYNPPPGPQTMTLATQDITTGAARIIFSLTSSSLGLGYFLLAPDGKHALFYNVRWRDDPYTPDVRLIDMATGAATSLPHLSQALGQSGGATSIAWRAGTMTLAASTGFLVNGDLKMWLLDAQHDTAQVLPYQAYVGGWAPDSDTLVFTTSLPLSVGYAGPFTLTAIANATSGTGTPTTLTDQAYHLSFAGFARTAS